MLEILQPFQPLILLIVLIILDFVSGTVGAFATDSYDSSKMRRGLFHMVSYVLVIALTLVIEEIAKYYDLGYVYATALYSLVYIWIVVTEVCSILENLVKINPALGDNSFMRIFANQAKEIERQKADKKVDKIEDGTILNKNNKVGF